MNGRDKRKKRAQRERDMAPLRRIQRKWKCPNGCGETGPHFVPPSFGDSGFYICTPLPKPDDEQEAS
jgi:hypothetical protein